MPWDVMPGKEERARKGGREGTKRVNAQRAGRWGGREGVTRTFQSTGLEVGQDDDLPSEQLLFCLIFHQAGDNGAGSGGFSGGGGGGGWEGGREGCVNRDKSTNL